MDNDKWVIELNRQEEARIDERINIKRGFNIAIDAMLNNLQTFPTEDYENAEQLRRAIFRHVDNMEINL